MTYCLRASTCPPFLLLNRLETSITTRPAPAAPAVSRCLQREKKCTCKVFTEAAILKIPQLCLTADSVKPLRSTVTHRWHINEVHCWPLYELWVHLCTWVTCAYDNLVFFTADGRQQLLCCFAASFSNVININSPISSSKWNEIKCLTRGMTHLTWWHFHVPDMSPHRKMTSSSCWFIQQRKDLIAALSRLLKGSIFEFQFPSSFFFLSPVPSSFCFTQDQQISDLKSHDPTI